MPDSLIIRLPEDEGRDATWLVFDAVAGRVGAPQSGPLTLAGPIAASRRVIALIPGVEVLLAEPELPVRGGARLAQVIPFALEEQLACDVDTMHFAVGRREAGHAGTPVTAIPRERMAHWLGLLRAAQIEPEALYSDSAVLPVNPGQSVLVIEGERLFLRHPGQLPLVLDAQPLQDALELADCFPQAGPRNAIVYLSQEDWTRHQASLDAVRERFANLKIQLLPHGVLPLLATQAATRQATNLLQGSFAAQSSSGERWRSWRLAAILLAALIGLNLASKAVDLYRLGKQESALDAAIEQVFRESMGEQNAVDARRRMEARLSQIRGGATDGETLLEVLDVMSNAFTQVPGVSIDAMSYRSNVLDLRVEAQDVTSLDRLRTLVTERGMQAELQSSDAREKGVEGRIQIKGRGKS